METQEQQIEQTPLADATDDKTPASEFVDDSTPEEKAEAIKNGWRDPSKWVGEPPEFGFRTARDWNRRGKEVLPFINKKLREELATANEKLETLQRETADKIERMGRMSKVALDRQRQQLEDKYEALKENAVETGDKAAYKAADKAGKDALAEFDKAADAVDEGADKSGKDKKFEVPAPIKAAVESWVAENPWMKTDEEMNAVANARHAKLLKEKPGLTISENLAEVRAYVKKRFPEKFGDDDGEGDEGSDAEDTTTRRGPPVESGSRLNGGGGKSAWSRIPADAKAQADKFIKGDGLFLEKGETADKNLQQARERYARQYLENE